MTGKTIESVLEENTGSLMRLKGVIGVAIGVFQEQPCIRVFVDRKTDELQRQIPHRLEGYAVLVEQKGRFRALDR